MGLLYPDDWSERLAEGMRVGEQASQRRRKYSGELAKPIPTSPDGGLGLNASGHAAQKRADAEFARRLLLLFEWHRVPEFDWRGLALELARSHVPGLQFARDRRRAGRPRKYPAGGLLDPRLFRRNGKAGRPARWTPELRRKLLVLANQWRESERAAGRRNSDRAFVAAMCKEHAERNGERLQTVVNREARALENALSRARRVVSKP